MNLNKFKKTFDGVRAENRIHRQANTILAVAVLVSMFGLLSRDEVVVLQPPTLTEEAEIGPNWASESYHKSWGLYLATLMGNVTPGNGDIIKRALEPLLDSSIYQQAMDLVDAQVQQIRRDQVTFQFEPQSVTYEKDSQRVFITGYSKVTGPTGKQERNKRTFEYELHVSNYRPVLVDLETYGSDAKTSDVVEKERAREQRQREKERKREREKG